MTILRSREIVPKSHPKTLKSRKIEPSTPSIIQEKPKPDSTMLSSTPSTEPKPELLGSRVVSESVSDPNSSSLRIGVRRSLRLQTALKSKIAMDNDPGKISITSVVNSVDLIVDDESRNSEDSDEKGNNQVKRNTRVSSLGLKKGKVFDSVDDEGKISITSVENGVNLSVGDERSSEDSDEKGNNQGKRNTRVSSSRLKKGMVFDSMRKKESVSRERTRVFDGLGSNGDGEKEEVAPDSVISKVGPRRRSERLGSSTKGKGKRKLEFDLNSPPLDLGISDGSDKGFFNLRSGARISKRRIEGIMVDPNGIDNVGEKLASSERESKEKDKEGEQKFVNAIEEDDDVVILEVNPNTIADEMGPSNGKKRYTREEKGKGRLIKDTWLSIGIDPVELDLKPEEENLLEDAVSGLIPDAASGLVQLQEISAVEHERQIAKTRVRMKAMRRRLDRGRFQDAARQSASRFAHFQPEEEDYIAPLPEPNEEIEDWPGPFSTAMKIIRDRATKQNGRQMNSTSGVSNPAPVIEWKPSNNEGQNRSRPLVPSLRDLSMNILAKNAEAITSLKDVPDGMRNKLSQLLCDSRRMDCHFVDLLGRGSPSEICVKDCSWMTEEEATKIFGACDTNNLTVLQLDQCGRCMPDYILRATLASSPSSLAALVSISLRGGCRITDIGLNALVASAPALRSLNLGQCSLLTSIGINNVADSLGTVLRELYIDDCQNIDAMLILPALKKLEHLEVLSVADIQTVCDAFIHDFITVCGSNMKELVLANCGKLTDTSLKVIAESCSGLCALDLVNLHKLTDVAIGHLANGCQSIQTLKLCRNAFSDESIAAFLEASGESLKELSLNNVKRVGHNTAISLARCSKNLLSLDLSWCRNLADEAVGLIVDNCSSLRVLKLFGCTQITNTFFNGHSNPLVRIIGLKLTPILEHLNVLDRPEAPLRY